MLLTTCGSATARECVEEINDMIMEFNFVMRYMVEELGKENVLGKGFEQNRESEREKKNSMFLLASWLAISALIPCIS